MTHAPSAQRHEAENIRNECKRHCRIGKVKMKLTSGYGLIEFDMRSPDAIIRRLRSPIDETVRAPMTWGGGYVHTTRADDVPPVFTFNTCSTVN